MEFRILGPLEICVRGRPAPLAGTRQRTLLALLLLNAGRTVPVHTLVDAVWDERPPATAKRQIQNRVSALRRLLAAAASSDAPAARDGDDRLAGAGGLDHPTIVAEHDGYRLHLATATLDATVFQQRVDTARRLRQVGEPSRAAAELRSALSLWRGAALAGLSGRAVEAAAARLDEQRRVAIEERVDLELSLGQHADLIGELTELVAMDPLRERLVGHLMLALYRCGRQPDALAVYRRLRDRLASELGLDPGGWLQRLHSDILSDDPGLRREEAAPAPSAAPPAPGHPVAAGAGTVVPAQLPADVAAFTGRAAQLAELDRLLGDRTPGSGATICTIAGTAGVGKTAVAVHWGHRVRQRFPDGQLYVNLRGFDPAGPPLDPAEALRGFLEAFGVAVERIPVDLPARAALYRSLLADRRVLVILDNARDAGQIRWLLPGSPTCVAVATSRGMLPGLVAAECAHLIVLGLLSAPDARQMLGRRVGMGRLAAEPAAVDEIIARCARLPLAIAVVAARAATHPGFPLSTIVGELRAARGALDPFAGGDPTTDLRAVLSCSYQDLSTQAKVLFRLLGLHPGPDVTVPAAASLAATTGQEARAALTELSEANLVDEYLPGRYTFHDLLRGYAAELVDATEPYDTRRAAMHRLLDHLLHTAYAADRMIDRFRDPIDTPAPVPGVTVVDIADHEHAMDWFAAELPVLLTSVGRAFDAGFDAHAWRLAWALAYFLERRGRWRSWAAAHRTALAAACRLGDGTGQAHAHRSLGRVHVHLDQPDRAVAHLQRAHDLFDATGDLAGHARIHFDLCWISNRQGDHKLSLEHARRAHELFQATDNLSGQARALNNVAWGHHHLGDHGAAQAAGERALALNRQTGDRYGEADSWDTLGQAHVALHHHDESISCYRRARALYHDLGHRWGEADTLIRLGDAHEAAGDRLAAADVWRQAVAILDELGHPDARLVRARLARRNAHT